MAAVLGEVTVLLPKCEVDALRQREHEVLSCAQELGSTCDDLVLSVYDLDDDEDEVDDEEEEDGKDDAANQRITPRKAVEMNAKLIAEKLVQLRATVTEATAAPEQQLVIDELLSKIADL